MKLIMLNLSKKTLKRILLVLSPHTYYRWLSYRLFKDHNINNPYVKASPSITYDTSGKYPTMYSKPPRFYIKKKKMMKFDPNGIPILIINNDVVYHPVYITQYGLAEYGYYVNNGDETHFNEAVKIADWLISTQDERLGCWYYNFDFLHKMTNDCLKSPWVSSMAQGQAISLLCRVYAKTRELKYINAAVEGTKILEIPISEGGLSVEFYGRTIYEEFPTRSKSITLNGFMFCVLGLYDLSRYTSDDNITMMWKNSIDTLLTIIPFFDGDLMSSYCLSHISLQNTERLWADAYHSIHIVMMQNFQSIMPSPVFSFYIKRWASFWGIHIK